MIRVSSISIQEFRGIRNLTLELNNKNFAVCGPNGTGKSGIVDALEFALTGNISRLSGAGTGDLSVKEHGPHVDFQKNPEKASVSLSVYIPSLNKSATIVRTVKAARAPKITPADDDVKAAFAKIEQHPEFVLSRREIIRYVLAEPGRRASEVQALLRLDEVENLRTNLRKISNATARDVLVLRGAKDSSVNNLMRALGVSEFSSVAILKATNAKRTILSLPLISELTASTSIKEGILSADAAANPTRVNKIQARADFDSAREKINNLQSEEFGSSCEKVVTALTELGRVNN